MRAFCRWLFGSLPQRPAAAPAEGHEIFLHWRDRGDRYGYVARLYEARITAAERIVEHFGRLAAIGKSSAEKRLYDNAVAFLTMHLATCDTHAPPTSPQ